jgi:hypothetical protein
MAITEIKLSGKVFTDAGSAVNGATVALLETGTSTEETSTTTNSSGEWSFTETSLDATYDVKITSGSSVRYILWSDEITVTGIDAASMKIRGTEGAAAPLYFFADQADDAGDAWRIQASASDTLAIGSDKASAGTIIDYLTITNGANAAASVTTILGQLTVGVNDTGADVKFFGATAGSYWLWDESADGVVQIGTLTVGVDDAGHDVKLFGDTASRYWLWDTSADGVVQRGTLTVGVDDTGHDVKFFGATAGSYWLWDESADGVVQIGTLTVGVDDAGHDVKFFGDTASAYIMWDTSADKLLTAGGAVIDIVKDKLLIGSTAVTTTAAELNVLDNVTAGTVTASLGVVVDSNKDIGTFRNITLSGELDAVTLDLSSSADIAGDLVLSGGADGALQFTNAGENSIKIPDNQASALIIEEADNAYITFVTTNSSEAITVAKATTFSAGIADAGTIAAGTWNGTDVGVAYGGTGASSLTDGGVLLGSGTGAITAMSVLSDGEMIVGDGTTDPVAESGATLRTSIGVGTGDSPQFTGIELGHASDTTIVRSGSGDITIEGNAVYRAGGTDVAVADGGTGASTLTDGGVLLGSGTSAVTAMAVLADSEMIVGDGTTDPVAESGATLRTSIGVGTGDSPQFTAIELGHASDTTIARSGSGAITVEGTQVLLAGAALTGTTGTFSGVLDITDTTDSSDATGDTGALRTEGGASIAKKLYVGTDLDIDGTTNLDAVDIDGNVQLDGTLTIGADDTGYDVKFFGATAGAYMLWDESADALHLNQGTTDSVLFSVSSSDVTHGMTAQAPATTFGLFRQANPDEGGLRLDGFTSGKYGVRLRGFYHTDDTAKTTSAIGGINLESYKRSGTDAGNPGTNANLVVFYSSGSARFAFDTEGDFHYDGSLEAFADEYDDAHLVRALDYVREEKGAKGLIRSKWDDFVKYSESTLIELGILGDTLGNGGLVNMTALQRLHNGAIWQGYQKQCEMQERIDILETKLLAIEGAK